MVTGFWHLQNEDRLREALKFANACGAITVTERGAIPALPDLDSVLSFISKVPAWEFFLQSCFNDYKSMQFVNLLSFLFSVKQNYSKGKVMLDHLCYSSGLGFRVWIGICSFFFCTYASKHVPRRLGRGWVNKDSLMLRLWGNSELFLVL
jgi:hypothetical protein